MDQKPEKDSGKATSQAGPRSVKQPCLRRQAREE